MQGDSLTHLDPSGAARMVDVSAKQPTLRRARARALVRMSTATAQLVQGGDNPKGDVRAVARIAAIMAAKRTAELVPLAHPLNLDLVDCDVAIEVAHGLVTVECEARTTAGTGVEMEAMVGASVGALAVYDMVKGVEQGVIVERVELLEKTGGKSDFHRAPTPVEDEVSER